MNSKDSNFQKLAEKYGIVSSYQLSKKIAETVGDDRDTWKPKIDRLWKGQSLPQLHTFIAVYSIGLECSADELIAVLADDDSRSGSLSHLLLSTRKKVGSKYKFEILSSCAKYTVFPNNNVEWCRSFEVISLVDELTSFENIERYYSTGSDITTSCDSSEVAIFSGQRFAPRREYFTNVYCPAPLHKGDSIQFEISHRACRAEPKDAHTLCTGIRFPTTNMSIQVTLHQEKSSRQGNLLVYDSEDSCRNDTPLSIQPQQWNRAINGFLVEINKPPLDYWYKLQWK